MAVNDSRPAPGSTSPHLVPAAGPIILWLRLGAIAAAVSGVVIAGRMMIALSAPVDLLLAIAAAGMFAYKFER
jgi:hypothetical protein